MISYIVCFKNDKKVMEKLIFYSKLKSGES